MAAKVLLSKNPNIFFVLAGKGLDKHNSELCDWIDSNDIRSNFRLVGEHFDIPVLMNSLDIFCLPSVSEGFPNVLAEAIMLRIPIISSNCNSGPAEILLQKSGPQIFKKGNHMELKNKLNDFLLKPKTILLKRKFLFNKLKRFNKKKIVEEYDNLFSKLFI